MIAKLLGLVPVSMWMALVAVAVGAGAGWTASGQLRVAPLQAQVKTEQAGKQRAIDYLDTIIARINGEKEKAEAEAARMAQEMSEQVRKMDASFQTKLQEKQHEVDSLERDLRSGAVRVRVAGNGAETGDGAGGNDAVPKTAAAPGVGDAACTLKGDALQAFLDLRRAVEEDETKLAYLQQWARDVAGAGND